MLEKDQNSAETMILERLDLRKSERRFVPLESGIMATIGAFLFIVGFWNWFKIIYPIENVIRQEQLTQLKIQLGGIKAFRAHITSHSKGQLTVGFCSFVACFN
ncbi:hypothetical protein WDB89_10305 [Pseudoalteromonas sp. B5MOD-1]|uniref:hypothetical protein n=1 Tax=Pseudoalteromonas sp. P80D2 TaxID=3113903 RepID=UPI002FC63608